MHLSMSRPSGVVEGRDFGAFLKKVKFLPWDSMTGLKFQNPHPVERKGPNSPLFVFTLWPKLLVKFSRVGKATVIKSPQA